MKTIFAVLFTFLFVCSGFGQQSSGQKTLAADFSANTLTGEKINTAELRGKIIVLNLWFINCPNCIQEIKLLNKIVDQYKDNKDVVFLALAANKKNELDKFLKKNPFAYQIIPDSAVTMLSKFGQPDKNGKINIGFPLHIVIDRKGETTVRVEGIKGVQAVEKELKKQLPANESKSK